jgi:hypothetical protein
VALIVRRARFFRNKLLGIELKTRLIIQFLPGIELNHRQKPLNVIERFELVEFGKAKLP